MIEKNAARLAIAVAVSTGALARAADAPPPPPVSGAGPMTPPIERVFVSGVAVAPAEGLLKWLAENAQTKSGEWRHLRFPVEFGAPVAGQPRRRAATLGGVPVKLDDSALGVALDDRVHQHCGSTEGACRLWLEGHWGRRWLPEAPTGAGPRPPVIALTRVVGPVTTGGAEVLVEASPTP